MISGTVNSRLEAIVGLAIADTAGQFTLVQVTIDTGFTGELTRTPAIVTTLGLPQVGEFDVQLADGSITVMPSYSGWVDWDGAGRAVEILLSDSEVLIGMAMLAGFRLEIDAIVGGAVTIEAIP